MSDDLRVSVRWARTTLHALDDIHHARPPLRGVATTIVQLELVATVIEAVLTASNGVRVGTLAPLRPLPPSVLGLLDIIVVNAAEARQVLGDAAEASFDGCGLAQDLVQLGPRAAVVTLGATGAAYADKLSADGIPAQVVDVAETRGAGDAFLGTLALLLARGASLADVVTAGTAAGTMAVTGARQGRR